MDLLTSSEASREALREGKLTALFNELGWDNLATHHALTIEEDGFELRGIAQKRGVQVFECRSAEGAPVPVRSVRLRIDSLMRQRAHEHLIIFTGSEQPPTEQIWQWAERETGKPHVVREHTYHAVQPGDSLLQKLEGVRFDLSAEESLTLSGDVLPRLREAFGQRERVTRRFYDVFLQEQQRFLNVVEGMAEESDRQWYASVMLNRLMFVYFVQKKGFLDGDIHYLRNKLELVRNEPGADGFFTFYRAFLRRLFHEGFAQPAPRDGELDALIGNVPFLNGGIFDVHELESRHPDVDIPDEAFESLFRFFDSYEWHLDARPLRNDREINPEVLGYIFEKYVNQKQMGAYYTKEDITEYIASNSLIPLLLEKTRGGCEVAFDANGAVWRLLRDDPDRYIFDSVRHGMASVLPSSVLTSPHDPTASGATEPVDDSAMGLPTRNVEPIVGAS